MLAQGGVRDVRALLGGWLGWVQAGYPVKTGDAP